MVGNPGKLPSLGGSGQQDEKYLIMMTNWIRACMRTTYLKYLLSALPRIVRRPWEMMMTGQRKMRGIRKTTTTTTTTTTFSTQLSWWPGSNIEMEKPAVVNSPQLSNSLPCYARCRKKLLFRLRRAAQTVG